MLRPMVMFLRKAFGATPNDRSFVNKAMKMSSCSWVVRMMNLFTETKARATSA
jgi:hypothetical protein